MPKRGNQQTETSGIPTAPVVKKESGLYKRCKTVLGKLTTHTDIDIINQIEDWTEESIQPEGQSQKANVIFLLFKSDEEDIKEILYGYCTNDALNSSDAHEFIVYPSDKPEERPLLKYQYYK